MFPGAAGSFPDCFAGARPAMSPLTHSLVYLVAGADPGEGRDLQRQAAQAALEAGLTRAIEAEGGHVRRAHAFHPEKGNGFIDSQRQGMAVFRDIPKEAPVVVAVGSASCSHPLLIGLTAHRGPILTVADENDPAGQGGLLHLNGCLLQQGVPYATLWSGTFTDAGFVRQLRLWLAGGRVRQDAGHVVPWAHSRPPAAAAALGAGFAREFRDRQHLLGVFDEGCLGRSNGIIPDPLLHAVGVFKERLSQASLQARAAAVTDREAGAAYEGWAARGLRFAFGSSPATGLTKQQVLLQAKVYIAAVRLADELGCVVLGLPDPAGRGGLLPATGLIEGTLNNADRPAVHCEWTKKELFPGEAMPHGRGADECAALDGLITALLWRHLGFAPENSFYSLRLGRPFHGAKREACLWSLGAEGAPPAHFIKGWKGASSARQPGAPSGGGNLWGSGRPGWMVWSRVFVANDALHYDAGLAESVVLSAKERENRPPDPEGTILHAVFPGISLGQMMARHPADGLQIAFAPDKAAAKKALHAKAAAMWELGLQVSLCGAV
jgi:hypothetical protein